MAINIQVGGIRLDDNRITTVLPVSMLMDLAISGMAFEPKEKAGEAYDHLDGRVKELLPARGSIQRAFFARAMKNVRVTDPATGERRTERAPTGWSPTRKHQNATTSLLKYIQGPFLDRPPLNAALPAFVIYCPELLSGVQHSEFNAHMGGEFYLYDLDPSKKFMIADGESRHLAIELSLAANSKLSGSRKEKLRSSLVTVEVIHGIPPQDMGQMFADLNGKGVTLTKNEVNSLDVRDPWARAAKEIFAELKIPLLTSGRQVTAVAMAENKHLLVGHAITMVRALGLGGYSKAVSSAAHDEVIKDPKDFDRLVRAGVEWFGIVLDHFDMPMVGAERSGEIFTDQNRVLRAMPIKVALGAMGNAWFDVNLPAQSANRAALGEINWTVSKAWQGVAGKVKEAADGEVTLAASGAKEIGAAALRALTNPESVPGARVRGRAAKVPAGSAA